MAETSYVIACSSRGRAGNFKARTMFMVDRKVDQSAFWRTGLLNVLVLYDKNQAEQIAKKLKYNQPRVILYSDAEKLVKDQSRQAASNRSGQHQTELDLRSKPTKPTYTF